MKKISLLVFIFSISISAQWFWQNPLPIGNSLYGISFTDANTGTAVGGNGTILRTTNGGAAWILQSSGTIELLNGVSFTDANNGTAVGYRGTILRTTNGGAVWTAQSSGTTNELTGVSFTDENTGTAVGWYGTILRTTNGGADWTPQSSWPRRTRPAARCAATWTGFSRER